MTNKIDILNHDFNVKLDRIDNDIILMENPIFESGYEYPFSSECLMCVIVTGGSLQCTIDLDEYDIKEKGLLLILPGRIVQRIALGKDFKGCFIIMSENFTHSLNIINEYALFNAVKTKSFSALDDESIASLISYFKMIQAIIRQEDNPNRIEIVRHLTIAYNLGLGYYIHKSIDNGQPGGIILGAYEKATRKFMNLVREKCKGHRDMEFYAGQLFITPKHLSTVIKKVTGKTAMKWIEEYTILNAKTLLRTTNLTVGQVSDELNFSSQSDFGKYFKRFTGISPKEFQLKR
ncbi:MAG: helix-turn-helix domain-containing protein [Bacteroidales bacterium]|jgi:AraC-like DNA-binding protein|nr:helix-turn-helix domain-containing protein [Bacteroidales bacterium]